VEQNHIRIETNCENIPFQLGWYFEKESYQNEERIIIIIPNPKHGVLLENSFLHSHQQMS